MDIYDWNIISNNGWFSQGHPPSFLPCSAPPSREA